jgi:hypothetical protein
MMQPMRPAVLLLALLPAVVLAVPSEAASQHAYSVHVLPDPTGDVSPYGRCGALEGYVAGQETGYDARQIRVPAGSTLRASLVAQANVFAGDLGLDWSLRVYDARWRELARSSGPPWRTTVMRSFATAQTVWLLACNRRGHPDARVTYTLG